MSAETEDTVDQVDGPVISDVDVAAVMGTVRRRVIKAKSELDWLIGYAGAVAGTHRERGVSVEEHRRAERTLAKIKEYAESDDPVRHRMIKIRRELDEYDRADE